MSAKPPIIECNRHGSWAFSDAEEEEVTTVTSSVRRNSTEKTVSTSTTIKNSKGFSFILPPSRISTSSRKTITSSTVIVPNGDLKYGLM
ncbi:hypothetical protein RR46_11517 [Papilio xuthus]|uniref:Uncharacterized protein n=1 Tax=Papilio xuthus TaxID=66420 RepID=A0A194PSR9_PAPXU|nr:hypothetical protein RR46_11517 [Papilio xuthus]